QTGVLVLCVLLLQWLFRRQLTNRWRFALWWIMLARLVLPFGPESELSLFNCFRSAPVAAPVSDRSSAVVPRVVTMDTSTKSAIVPASSQVAQPSPTPENAGSVALGPPLAEADNASTIPALHKGPQQKPDAGFW